MKLLWVFVLFFLCLTALGQKKNFTVLNISLPAEISDYDNQFSGLSIQKENLYLMSESRLQDSAEAKLYSIKLADLEKKITDTAYILPYKKFHVYNLEWLRERINRKGDEYEGLEAIVMNGNDVYFSIETTTASLNCYLLKGQINDTALILYTDFFISMPKPVTVDSLHIYNAGFEALTMLETNIMAAFFEFNYFTNYNQVLRIIPQFTEIGRFHHFKLQRLPFRLTDITSTGENKFTAINYFYKGGGADTVYRPYAGDISNKLILDDSGYGNYCRLVQLKYKNFKFSWKPLWEFPKEYAGYNWEGIAVYKNGYFIINDKYTPEKPYKTVLLYLKEK